MAKKKPTKKASAKTISLADAVVALEKAMRREDAGMASVVLSDRNHLPKIALILVDGPNVPEVTEKLHDLRAAWSAEAERADAPDAPSEGANPV